MKTILEIIDWSVYDKIFLICSVESTHCPSDGVQKHATENRRLGIFVTLCQWGHSVSWQANFPVIYRLLQNRMSWNDVSQLLPVSCLELHSFVLHQKWNFMFLVLQNSAKKKFCCIQSLLFKAVFVSNSTSGLAKIKGYTGGKFSKYLPLLIILFLESPK